MEYTQPVLRPWREIAQEVATEHDPNRILELTDELNAALDDQTSLHAHKHSQTVREHGKSSAA